MTDHANNKRIKIEDILNSLNGTYQQGSRVREVASTGLAKMSLDQLEALWAMVVTTVDPVNIARKKL